MSSIFLRSAFAFIGSTLALSASSFAQAPAGMVAIPAGEFVMGTDDPNSFPDERPAHKVQLKAFFMDETPVTNAQFRAFVEATGYVTTAEKPVDWEELKKQAPPGTPKPSDELLQPGSLVFTPSDGPVDLNQMANWWTWTNGADWKHPQGPKSSIEGKDDLPVVQVGWDDAVAYAKWAGKRLPTEAEWEYASRGGSKTNTRYWWGDELAPAGKFMANTFTGDFPYRNSSEDGFVGVAPVKAFPANGFGLYGMAGNVWQWTGDVYERDTHTINAEMSLHEGCMNPTGPDAADVRARTGVEVVTRVIKGGSYLCNPSYCESYRPTARRGTPADTGSEHVGFRCVMDVPSTDVQTK
ncbi:MAG TPA: formylglycine-generating enzyme family protein [Tepidisphaeraceae bacterium]|nr:formylglycine-generating enzyme family protein [Tepidisphaeraceae bacterium]